MSVDEDESKIVGGELIEITDRPFQVAFLYNGNLRCGGAWLGGNVVLTAAHCCNAIGSPQFTNQDGEILDLSDTKIAAGERRSCTSISHLPSLHGSVQVKKIKSLVMHPQYDSIAGTNDICLLTLESPLEFNDNVKSISIDKNKPVVGTNTTCLLSGWGRQKVGRT